MPRPQDRRRIPAAVLWPTAVLLMAFVSYAIASYRQLLKTVDDAYISFRFAQHLAEGQGLVWNIGGAPTEGYTNFTWVLILAGCHRLGLDLEAVAPIIIMATTLITAALLLWIGGRHVGAGYPLASVFVAMFLADSYTAVHTISGLETLLAVFVVTVQIAASLQLLARPSAAAAAFAGLSFVAGILTRPDMVLFAGGLSLALCTAWRRIGISRLVVVFATAGSLTAVYAAWKWQYFGYLLPNPFYVKSAPENMLAFAGLRPVLRFLAHIALQGSPIALPILVVVLRRRATAAEFVRQLTVRWQADPVFRSTTLILLVPPAIALAYFTTIIHEVGFAGRFSFPTYPYLLLAGMGLAAAVAAQNRDLFRRAEQAIQILMILVIVATTDWRIRIGTPGFPAEFHMAIAQALKQAGSGPETWLHFTAAGLIPYESGVSHVDPIGLVDNDLSGRRSLTRESYDEILWSRPADVYLGSEPPASAGATTASDDPIMQSAYIRDVLSGATPFRLSWLHPRFGPMPLDQRREFLHRTMRRLRDEWTWLGEDYSAMMWDRVHMRTFVYVRRSSPARERLIAALTAVATIPPGSVDLTHAEPAPR